MYFKDGSNQHSEWHGHEILHCKTILLTLQRIPSVCVLCVLCVGGFTVPCCEANNCGLVLVTIYAFYAFYVWWCYFSEGPRLQKINPPRIECIERIESAYIWPRQPNFKVPIVASTESTIFRSLHHRGLLVTDHQNDVTVTKNHLSAQVHMQFTHAS